MNIPTFDEAYNYFLLQQEDELLRAQAHFEEFLWASTYAEEEAAYEAEVEKACLPLYMAEEQAMAQDRANKTKHRKHRKSERDEFRHHRKPTHKWNREACNEFALNRKAEKRRLNAHNLLSQYEAEKVVEEKWVEKEQEETNLYMDGEDIIDYVWETTIHENGLNDLWNSVSEDGYLSYSGPEDFGFEVEEEEEEVTEEEQEDLFGELETPECDCNSYEFAETEEELATKAAYNRGYITGYFTGREEGKKHVLDLLKEAGICVDLKALEETLFSKML